MIEPTEIAREEAIRFVNQCLIALGILNKLKLEMVMDIKIDSESMSGICDSLIRLCAERDALNAQLETTKRELMATTISWENALAELQKARESSMVPAMPIPKQDPEGAVPDDYTLECLRLAQGARDYFANENAELKKLLSNKSARITEQDAREIIEDYIGYCDGKRLKPQSSVVMGMYIKNECTALLNKLNANAVAEVRKEPVSQDREMLITLMSAFDTEHSICENCGHQEETMYMDSANMLRDYLQSNPVPAQAAAIPDCFIRLLNHAIGLQFGVDWNNGTAAQNHRQKLCDATNECEAMLSPSPKPE